MCQKRGFVAVNEIRFDDYLYENESTPFKRVDPKHQSVIHFFKKL